MTLLKEIAGYIRSKNAGPFWVTIDVFCRNAEDLRRIRESGALSVPAVADLYDVEAATVKVFFITELNAVKISFPRPQPQGGMEERDMHAGQYYVRLLDVEIPPVISRAGDRLQL